MDSNIEELITELSKHITYRDILIAKIEAKMTVLLLKIKLAIANLLT